MVTHHVNHAKQKLLKTELPCKIMFLCATGDFRARYYRKTYCNNY